MAPTAGSISATPYRAIAATRRGRSSIHDVTGPRRAATLAVGAGVTNGPTVGAVFVGLAIIVSLDDNGARHRSVVPGTSTSAITGAPAASVAPGGCLAVLSSATPIGPTLIVVVGFPASRTRLGASRAFDATKVSWSNAITTGSVTRPRAFRAAHAASCFGIDGRTSSAATVITPYDGPVAAVFIRAHGNADRRTISYVTRPLSGGPAIRAPTVGVVSINKACSLQELKMPPERASSNARVLRKSATGCHRDLVRPNGICETLGHSFLSYSTPPTVPLLCQQNHPQSPS